MAFMLIIRGMRVERIVQFVLHPQRIVMHDRIVLHTQRTKLCCMFACCAVHFLPAKQRQFLAAFITYCPACLRHKLCAVTLNPISRPL